MKKKKREETKKKRKFSTSGFYRFVIFSLAFLIILGIITYDKRASEWKFHVNVGEPALKDMYSPLSFTFVDEEQTEAAKQFATRQVLNIYTISDKVNERIVRNLDLFLAEIEKMKNVPPEEADAQPPQTVQAVVAEASVKELLKLQDFATFKETMRTTVVSVLDKGLISFSKKVELLDENKRAITLIRVDEERMVNVLDLTSLSEMRDRIYQIAVDQFPKQRRVRDAFVEIINNFLKANIVYDIELTQQRRARVYTETPDVEVSVKKNEIVLRRGSIITSSALLRLKEIEKKITKKKQTIRIIGSGVIILFFFIILWFYLFHFERKIYDSLKDVLLINSTIVLNMIINKFILSFMQVDVFLLPTSLSVLLLAILIKPRIGVIIAIGMSILNGVMTNYDVLIIMTTLLASMGGVYMMIDVRRRSRFFAVGGLVGIINFSVILSFFILQEVTIKDAFNRSLFGLVNGVEIIFLLFFGVWVLENVFDKTTSMKLLELSDLNHPILKRLIIEAPGTYHHSLVVSNLAESAAEAIRANSLLARVGSYFHDIGKIEKAEYFTENQTSKDRNYHDNLSPRMSYFIIANHIKDGIELARKYNLKKIIVDFIVQHHGTSVVYFFYKKALDEQKQDEKLNISDFRYAGPKPQSKEVAIVLLADSVEAASRTLSEPTPASLRGLVDKVVNDRFLDNQLDECELTVLDLHKIRESFVRNLMAIFHTRVEYPEMINEGIQGKKRNG